MKKIYIMLILFLIVFSVGCQKKTFSEDEPQACQRWLKGWAEETAAKDQNLDPIELEKTYLPMWCGDEEVDKTTKIISEEGYKNHINYSWNNYKFTGAYMPEFRDSMEWMKQNSPEDTIITSWWDYGHMIRAIGKRNAIIFNPSEEILNTVASVAAGKKFDTGGSGELSNHEDIKNVALILTTTNPKDAINLMQNYNSEYLLVTGSEYGKARVMYDISGIEYEIIDEYSGYYFNNESILYKMLKLQSIEGFEKLYSDSKVVIYKLKES